MSSARNGATGASSRIKVVRASYIVWYAESESRFERAFQNRGRLRSRYQVERSSQNASTLSSTVRTSCASIDVRLSATRRPRLERTQRSISGRSASGTSASDGSKSSRVAYVTKNEYVFQSTSSFRRRSSNGGQPKYIVSCRSSRATT